jgi:hypothetical protein
MSEIFAKNKTIIVVIIIGVVAFGAYYFFHKSTTPADGALVTSSDSGASESGAELVSFVASLNSITLDTSIFDNTVFNSFVDFSQPIPPQPKGGRNPFSQPVYSASIVGTSTTQ